MKILVVEDDEMVAGAIADVLKKTGHPAMIVSSGEEAIKRALETQPQLILMDINLSGVVDGIDAARQIQRQRNIPVIYMTAYKDKSTLDRAESTGPLDYLIKPFHKTELIDVLKMAAYRFAQVEKADRLNENK